MKDEIVLAAPIHVMDKLVSILSGDYNTRVNAPGETKTPLRAYGESESRLPLSSVGVFKALKIVKKGGNLYNLQNELWRPDLNIEQAIDLANYYGFKVVIEFPTFLESITGSCKKVSITSEGGKSFTYNAYLDKPQMDSSWANPRDTHKRNIARCIVHGCMLQVTGEPIEPYIWLPSV